MSKTLRYNFNAIADVEERAKTGIGTLLSEERIGFNSMRYLVWAGLKWEDRGLTIERTGLMLQQYFKDGGTFELLSLIVMNALKASGVLQMQEEETEEEKNVTTEVVN
jgi:hypothetical protein